MCEKEREREREERETGRMSQTLHGRHITSHDRRCNALPPLTTPDTDVCTYARALASCAYMRAAHAEKRAGQDCIHLGACAPMGWGGYTDTHTLGRHSAGG